MNEVRQEISYAPISHYGAIPPEVRGLDADSAWLLAWLRDNTSASGRVLFETSKARIHGGAHIAGYLAYSSDREFVGGPYPYIFFAGFWDGNVFGRPIEGFDRDEFWRYLRLYNVGWIVVFSDASKRFLLQLPGLVPGPVHGPFATFVVDQPLSFFLEGNGRIESRSINRLVLSQLSPEGVLLKYHYVPGLRAMPAGTVEPVLLPKDPEPFIRVRSSSPSVELTVRRGR
jgi:hypothetical protein